MTLDIRNSFRRIVQRQLEMYPLSRSRDLCKLAFQAAMGSAHAVPRRDAVISRLENEIAELVPGTSTVEPLVEIICPRGLIARVNLRPFRAEGLDTLQLAEAFMATATSFPGSQDDLRLYCSWLTEFGEEGILPEWMHEIRQIAGSITGPVHHTEIYWKNYMPAYRIVSTALITWS